MNILTGAFEETIDLYPSKRNVTVKITRYLFTGLVAFKEKILG